MHGKVKIYRFCRRNYAADRGGAMPLFQLAEPVLYPPASAYDDMGVHTFVPEEVYPVQRENHATGRQKRNHPTTTVYIVRYRAEDGSGYQYKYESGSVESTAQSILEADEPIERRVLSIPDEDGYITIGADETAQTYETRQKRTYWTIAGVSAAYLLVWLAVNGLLLYKRRKRM